MGGNKILYHDRHHNNSLSYPKQNVLRLITYLLQRTSDSTENTKHMETVDYIG